jgi:uroporphyrinogen decarboxylase
MSWMMTDDTLGRWAQWVRAREPATTMTALIVDSPWLPNWAGVSTPAFLFDDTVWLDVYVRAQRELEGAVLLPGAWAELGMAAEPSGWGVPVRWPDRRTPEVRPSGLSIERLAEIETPDPEQDGLMPLVLRRYERMGPALRERGMAPRMAAARGPLTIASHLLGMTEFLMATLSERETAEALLDRTTELCIRWLEAQLARMEAPLGVLMLDDLTGLLSPDDAAAIAAPRLKRVFDRFPGLVHVFHNDTPNPAVYPALRGIGMDVFNLTHECDLAAARAALGPGVVLMGNLPPLDLLVRGTPDACRQATEVLLARLPEVGPVLVSPGGGISPGTPVENLQAVIAAVRDSGRMA